MPDNLADCTPLLGRHFVTKSGNVCRTTKLGDGALRFTFVTWPTEADMAEAEEWAEGIIGPLAIERHIGKDGEREHLDRWKKGVHGGA